MNKLDELIKKISQYPNGTNLILKYENGLSLNVKIDTIYESNNGFEDNEEEYKEFYACAVKVESIINNGDNNNVSEESLIEISMENCPQSIELEDGTLVWK